MRGTTKIPLETGRYFYVSGNVECFRSSTGYWLHSNGKVKAIVANLEGLIAVDVAEELRSGHLGSLDNETVFDDIELSRSIFDWDTEAEINTLGKIVGPKSSEKGLDVGCGFGRLLLPMLDRGLHIDGLDHSLSAVTHVAEQLQRASNQGSSRVFCSDLSEFCAPEHYDYLFSALNTLRYCETWFAFRRHLELAWKSLKIGGRYAFQITVSDEQTGGANAEWRFTHKDRLHSASWKLTNIDRVRGYSIDHVKISDNTNNVIVREEFQHQLVMTESSLRNALASSSFGGQPRFFDESGEPLDSISRTANYWVLQNK